MFRIDNFQILNLSETQKKEELVDNFESLIIEPVNTWLQKKDQMKIIQGKNKEQEQEIKKLKEELEKLKHPSSE